TPVQAMAARAGSYGVRYAVGYGPPPEPWRATDRAARVGLAIGAGVDPMLSAIQGAPALVGAPARPYLLPRPGDGSALDAEAERRATAEVCALAARMQVLAVNAADLLRQTQRTYDTHLGSADQAEAISDPRAQRAAKDAAQQAFRADRAHARSREEVETAART